MRSVIASTIVRLARETNSAAPWPDRMTPDTHCVRCVNASDRIRMLGNPSNALNNYRGSV